MTFLKIEKSGTSYFKGVTPLFSSTLVCKPNPCFQFTVRSSSSRGNEKLLLLPTSSSSITVDLQLRETLAKNAKASPSAHNSPGLRRARRAQRVFARKIWARICAKKREWPRKNLPVAAVWPRSQGQQRGIAHLLWCHFSNSKRLTPNKQKSSDFQLFEFCGFLLRKIANLIGRSEIFFFDQSDSSIDKF